MRNQRLLRRTIGAILFSTMAASLPALAATESLPEIAHTQVTGTEAEGRLGQSLDGAGDFNGDGLDDLVVGGDGRAYVVLGGGPTDITAGANETRTIQLTPAVIERRQGLQVAGVGDVDGDGLADVMVGIETADPLGRRNAGSVFLVLGRTQTTPIVLDAAEAQQVVQIDGAAKGDYAGSSVAGAGDVDGDDVPDVILGARLADDGSGKRRGAAYVLFGHSLSGRIDLAAIGGAGFEVRTPSFGRSVGASVGRAGDMNGDGFGDLIVGAPSRLVIARPAAYVVFGKATTTDVILGALGGRGWIIKAGKDERQEGAGEAVDGGHDVNGDGVPDVIVGAPVAAGRYSGTAGAAFVIFGKSDGETVVLDALGSRGLLVQAGESSHAAGESVALMPDLDGDGHADALVGDPQERGRREDAPHGAVYHLVGQSGTEPVDLGRLGSDGVRYRGIEYGMTGASVAVVGDFDGDGAVDLAAGAPRADGETAEDVGNVSVFTPVAAPEFDNPPAAHIISFSAWQRADRGSSCWDGRCVDKVPNWQRGEVAGAGDRAHFRISFDERPDTFSLLGYRELDDSGQPAGPAIGFPVVLRAIRHYRGAPIAGYEAVFDLPKRPGHLYLQGAASWDEVGRGDATWLAHLRLTEQAAHTDMPRPPDATLRSREARQRGAIISYCWSQSFSNGTGVGQCADGIRTEPRRAEPAAVGAPARIRIHSRYRPDKVILRFYRAVRSGYPSGDSTRPKFKIEPHRRDGRIRAWDVVFKLPNREGHLYPLMDAQWDQHGSAPYDWHLSLR